MTDTRTEYTPEVVEAVAKIIDPDGWKRRAEFLAIIDGTAPRMPDGASQRAIYVRSAKRRVDQVVQRSLELAQAIVASLPAASERKAGSDLECAAQLERSGLITREKYNHICENIRARDRMREAMA